MKTDIFELSDGRILGIKVLEVISFPSIFTYGKNPNENCEKTARAFMQFITELHKLSGFQACMEFLWITEKVEHQTFISKIRIFGIIRKIGQNRQQITSELNNIQNNMLSSLGGLQYNVEEIDMQASGLLDLLASIDGSCVYSIVKREKCMANANSLYPYYYTDIIPNHNIQHFTRFSKIIDKKYIQSSLFVV